MPSEMGDMEEESTAWAGDDLGAAVERLLAGPAGLVTSGWDGLLVPSVVLRFD